MRRMAVVLIVGLVAAIVVASPASAYTFTRSLKEGDQGRDVKQLQFRMAGWYPSADQTHHGLDGRFGPATTEAVKAFQAFYGLSPDGIAGPATFAILDGIEDDNGSTLHFDWKEFKQKANSRCSAKANAYAGTFKGGMVAPRRARRNVKKLMWRLEALRAKAGDKPVGINSAFRSVSYNDCIGGARLSQHQYGTAVDNRMAEVTNRFERDVAKATQFHGIGCYSSMSHNHFDLRLDNRALDGGRYWWWPDRDKSGRDLADDGKPCWGEAATKPASDPDGESERTTLTLVPTLRFLRSFSATPEWYAGAAD